MSKTAVRRWLWDHGCGPVFPAEVRVREGESGRLVVAGQHGRTLPPLEISLEHRGDATVAIAVLDQQESPDLTRWLEPQIPKGIRW